MLIQERDAGLRLIPQHDHALVSGEMAQAWCGVGESARTFGAAFVVATALHDHGWRWLDDAPRLNPERGRPYDFVDYPMGDKLMMYDRAIAEAAALLPSAGLLHSRHYTAFSGTRGLAEFQATERARRAELITTHGLPGDDEPDARLELDYLKLFDFLSLYLCLAPPGADRAALPRWMTAELAGRTPEGPDLALSFDGPNRLRVDPFPFRAPLALAIAYRDLSARRFSEAATLADAFAAAPRRSWSVTLLPTAG